MREIYRYEALVTALSSISHIGDTQGITAEFRREKVISPDGLVERVPVVTGNSMRGILRDCAARHMLDVLGLDGLPLPAFYFLFSGGSLSKSGGTLNTEQVRRLAQLMPVVGLFGGAAGNYIMPGRLRVGKLIPLVQEAAPILPDRYRVDLPSVYDQMQIEAYVRKDDAKDDRLDGYLATTGLFDDVHETADPQQMRYYVETMAAGSQFYWYVQLDKVTDLERAAFLAALGEFMLRPYIGGKSAVGHGEISLDWGDGVSMTVPEMYTEHLLNHRADIEGVLYEL